MSCLVYNFSLDASSDFLSIQLVHYSDPIYVAGSDLPASDSRSLRFQDKEALTRRFRLNMDSFPAVP